MLFLAVAAMLLAALGVAYAINLPGGTYHSQSQIEGYFGNSSNSYLRDNASSFASMSSNVENSNGYTGTFNGNMQGGPGNGCCTGLMQINQRNLANPAICGCTPQEYAQMSGQQQIDVYGKYFDSGVGNSSQVKQLQQMQANGQTLGGQPVTAGTVVACAQLGTGNCQKAINSDCGSGKANGADGNGSTICSMGAKAAGKDTGNKPGQTNKDNSSGCTTPTDPKEATTPQNIGAGDGSGNTTPSASTGTDSTRTGGGTSDGSTGSGDGSATTSGAGAETPSKSVPCKQAEKKAQDKTSKTCQPTMKMINELQCSNFPSGIQAFCQQYKPKLMTSDECTRAEKMAEKEKKGDRQTECENQTFDSKGTSSWSYVLACSFTQKNQGTFGSATQSSNGSTGSSSDGAPGSGGQTSGDGNPNDPQCIERLKKRIPDLKILGTITSFGNGRSCGTKSGVSASSIMGITNTPTITAECLQMEKVADFMEYLKGLGITRVTNIGSLDRTCRPKRNGRGTIGGMTNHAIGYAVDFDGFYGAGVAHIAGKYHSDPSAKAWFDANIRPKACQIFKSVLGPIYYIGKYTHWHLDAWQKTRCDPPG